VLALWACGAPFALASGPHLYDAGELVAAAWTLGASHPPGQPLHALFAHFAALIPLGPIPARVALFSAACVLAAAFACARLCRALALDLGARARDANLAAAAAALGLLLASPILRQALRPEVYGMALALTLAAALELLRWARGDGLGHLMGAALLAGLADAVHPPHALAVALAALGFALAQPALLARKPLRLIACGVAFGLMGLCAYVYLPARDVAGAAMWGEATSLREFWRYVSAAAYARNMHPGVDQSFLGMLVECAGYAVAHGAAVGWIAALAACGLLAGLPRRLLIGALGASLLALLAACFQPLEARNPDNVAYLAPSIAFGIAAGAAACAAMRATRARWLGGVGLFFIALWPLSALRAADGAHNDLPALETLAGALTEAPPPRAVVIATTDFTAATWMMQQAIDGARPDAAMFVAGLSTSSWQWAQVARHHPAMRGDPVAGPGHDAHERYLFGAIERAITSVPVALEQGIPGVPLRAIAGAYEVLYPMPPLPSPHARAPIGTRLDPVIARAAARGPDGDCGAGAAIVRDYQQRRALRLAKLGRPSQALAELERSLWPLPAAQRALLRVPNAPVPARIQTWVRDPTAFLVTLEDNVRLSAALLSSIGHRQQAFALLDAQAERGDPRALLQLAWLQFGEGDREAAWRSTQDFQRAAPQLAGEAQWLRAALGR
jgi:hypothetical protein